MKHINISIISHIHLFCVCANLQDLYSKNLDYNLLFLITVLILYRFLYFHICYIISFHSTCSFVAFDLRFHIPSSIPPSDVTLLFSISVYLALCKLHKSCGCFPVAFLWFGAYEGKVRWSTSLRTVL